MYPTVNNDNHLKHVLSVSGAQEKNLEISNFFYMCKISSESDLSINSKRISTNNSSRKVIESINNTRMKNRNETG